MSQASTSTVKFYQHIHSMDSNILASYNFRRLKHDSHSQWKERILSIDSTANLIKEDNTIALATSFEKASRKAKRQQAKEGKKKKGSKSKTSAYNMDQSANERQSQNAAMAISLQDRLAAYQKQSTNSQLMKMGMIRMKK